MNSLWSRESPKHPLKPSRPPSALRWKAVAIGGAALICVALVSILYVRKAFNEMIAGYPAEAFDSHTRPGRWALSQFRMWVPEVSEILRYLPAWKQNIAIGHATFIVEGGQLENEITSVPTQELTCFAQRCELAHGGLHQRADQFDFLTAVSRGLPELNVFRRSADR